MFVASSTTLQHLRVANALPAAAFGRRGHASRGGSHLPTRATAASDAAPVRIHTSEPSTRTTRLDVSDREDLRAKFLRDPRRATIEERSTNLVATVAARSPPIPAPKVEEVSPFVSFCRANWGYFAALQTVALIGASFNGRLARKRRLEIAEINEKLRAMMAKYEAELSERCDDDGPASEALAEGKAALKAEDWNAAAEAFEEAKTIAEDADDAAGRLSASKGVAQALVKARQLRAAIAELESVVELAEKEGDSSVYGMLGDCHTDLAELTTAGMYYDKCLAMD